MNRYDGGCDFGANATKFTWQGWCAANSIWCSMSHNLPCPYGHLNTNIRPVKTMSLWVKPEPRLCVCRNLGVSRMSVSECCTRLCGCHIWEAYLRGWRMCCVYLRNARTRSFDLPWLWNLPIRQCSAILRQCSANWEMVKIFYDWCSDCWYSQLYGRSFTRKDGWVNRWMDLCVD